MFKVNAVIAYNLANKPTDIEDGVRRAFSTRDERDKNQKHSYVVQLEDAKLKVIGLR
jgi:hypothetical protein